MSHDLFNPKNSLEKMLLLWSQDQDQKMLLHNNWLTEHRPGEIPETLVWQAEILCLTEL